jgi:MSHA biogenesis protein MshO
MMQFQRGFTLIEAVIVMVITGIISVMVAVFIRAPVQGYFDMARRAELTDSADGAARRIARDLRLALPNSVRVAGATNNVIEFLPTRDGGRYRSDVGDAGAGNPLDFGTPADTTFDLLGQPINFQAGDQIVIYNTGYPNADAYAGNAAATDNRRAYNGTAGPQNTVSVSSVNSFSQESPSRRFQVISTPVTYICNGGILWRYWGYAIQPLQTSADTVAKLDALVTPASAARGKAQLAQNVTACSFDFTQGVNARNGLVSIRLSLTQSGEAVSLYHEVHVNNVP